MIRLRLSKLRINSFFFYSNVMINFFSFDLDEWKTFFQRTCFLKAIHTIIGEFKTLRFFYLRFNMR